MSDLQVDILEMTNNIRNCPNLRCTACCRSADVIDLIVDNNVTAIEAKDKTIEQQRALIEKMVGDIEEMSNYLDHGNGTTINNFSGFHRQMKDTLKAYQDYRKGEE